MAALNSSKLSMGALDRAVGHLFRLRIRLGYFDPPVRADLRLYRLHCCYVLILFTRLWTQSTTPWGNASHADLNYTEHYKQALRAAQEGIVLLENRRGTPPLIQHLH